MKTRTDFVSNSSSSSFVVVFRKKDATKEDFFKELGITEQTHKYFSSQAEAIFNMGVCTAERDVWDNNINDIKSVPVEFLNFEDMREKLRKSDMKFNMEVYPDFDEKLREWKELYEEKLKNAVEENDDETVVDILDEKPSKLDELGEFENYVRFFGLPSDGRDWEVVRFCEEGGECGCPYCGFYLDGEKFKVDIDKRFYGWKQGEENESRTGEARERLIPKGWRWIVCRMIYRIPRSWYEKQVPCPDGLDGCLVFHYERTWFGKTIGKWLGKITSRWDKRPWIVKKEPDVIAIFNRSVIEECKRIEAEVRTT